MFRVTFTVGEILYEILARNVDTDNHPYLVSVSDLEFEDKSSLIVSPNGDEARKRFGEVNQINIPVSELILIEEIPDRDKRITMLEIATDKEDVNAKL